MSFTMSQVKRKPSSKQQDIKSCYRLIYSDTILTNNIKQGLWQYCNYRFSKRNRGKFDAVILQKMVEDLLSQICHKNYCSISLNDVQRNENEILYHIKRAIVYGATRSIYYEQLDELNLDVLNTTIQISPPTKERMTSEDVIDYFKDIMM